MTANPQLEEILARAVEIGSADQRQAYIDQACAGQPELHRDVERLVDLHFQAGSFLESPAVPHHIEATFEQPPERLGVQIGSYKLLEQIGEGGFGVVYMAEQTEPVRRKVALKVLKPGMDSRQIVARFEAERQALALMDHSNIARVFDGGTTPSGRPYFVMELVKGTPITDYCDQHRLTPRQRLELFVTVCQAVQHAHQKGVIHRDIKPTNVLVTLHDTEPVVKVIDFGVAKALGQELTDKTLFTGFAQMVGTPLYMSPEQAGQSGLDIDTRSDIYSLGVLLYELLTGTTPIEKSRFQQAAYDEIRRIIREEEPPKPSTRLSSVDSAYDRSGRGTASPALAPSPSPSLASISAVRGTEPAKLAKLIRGELDWIVMKALEKDRSRRYETANGFAADLQRYLADEPVQACPPSAGYRFRKFARRHKGGLALAALVLLFLVLLGSGAGWAVRDRTARQSRVVAQVGLILGEVDRLEREQRWSEALAAARRAEAVAAGGEADAAIAQQVRQRLKDLEFLDLLEQIRMQRSTALVDGRFDHVRADREYARAFRDFGVDIEALAVETSIDRLKANPELAIPLAAALDDWAVVQGGLSAEDTSDWKRVAAIARGIDPDPLRDRLRSNWARPVSETQDEMRRLAESIDVRMQHPATLISLAITFRSVGHADSALRVLRDAQYLHPGDFWINYELGKELLEQKDHEGAVRFYTSAVSLRPNSTVAHNNLGAALREQKKLDEAIACFKRAIELDPKDAAAHTNLGTALREQEKRDEAIACYKKAIELDPKLAVAHNNLGTALREQKKLDEAIACFKRAIELGPEFARFHANLGTVLRDQQKYDEAIACYEKAIELDPIDAATYYSRARGYAVVGKWAEAAADFQHTWEIDHKYDDSLRKSAYAYLASGDTASYGRTCRELVDRFGQTLDPLMAERTAKVCTLAPGAVTNFGIVERLAHVAVTGTEQDVNYHYFVLAKGLTEGRAGRHAEAVKWLERFASDAGRGRDIDAIAFAALSMAQHRLGRTDEAKEALATAKAIVAEKGPDPYQGRLFEDNWHEWQHAQMLIREAEGLIGAVSQQELAALSQKRWDRMLDQLPHEPHWNSARMRLCREIAGDAELFDAMQKLRPDDADLSIARGQILAQAEKWEEAAEWFGRVIDRRGLSEDAFQSACLQLLTDRPDAYQQFCTKLIGQAGEVTDPNVAFVLARTCILVPEMATSPEQVVSWAEQAVSRERLPWHLHVLGAALSRAGQYARAIELLEESTASKWSVAGEAQNALVLAIAHKRQGNSVAAAECLDRARTLMAGVDRPPPPDWLEYYVLVREAEALIEARP